MGCSACERRRQAAKAFAVNIFKSIKPETKPETKPQDPTDNNVRTACANCKTHVRSYGWVNVCTLCGADSEAKPTPHTEKPKCNC